MIPLVLLIALASTLALVKASPKAHSWVDQHTQSLADALFAHRVADDHLQAAQAPMSPLGWVREQWDRIQSAHAAQIATQVAAMKTADAAQTAQTPKQRQDVADSAATVIDRQAKITMTLQQLGVGECSVRSYPKVAARIRDALIARLRAEKMDVTGSNPWDIETHQHGVKLRALWDPTTETLHLIVAGGSDPLLVTCDRIWEKIDPIIKSTIGV
jgi:hypothetical protein